MSKCVLASGNAGKLKELQAVLAPLQIELLTQKSLGIADADETGLSFVENAILKARHACQLSGLPAIADDSGLEVDYLQGAPGIYSARYAGAGATDAANVEKLLAALQDVPDPQRSARFHCVIVYMHHAQDPVPLICHGRWEGKVLHQTVGENGFGYDPVFWVPEQQCSSAQLAPEVKNRISHRGQALQQLLSLLVPA